MKNRKIKNKKIEKSKKKIEKLKKKTFMSPLF